MSKKTSAQKKIKVAEKCNWRCAYCGCELDLETMCIDHFLPKAKGGSNHLENLMPSCRSCNSTKGTSDLETFLGFVLPSTKKQMELNLQQTK